jgi:hypothetical protein
VCEESVPIPGESIAFERSATVGTGQRVSLSPQPFDLTAAGASERISLGQQHPDRTAQLLSGYFLDSHCRAK